jgi:hypothetical protein
VSTYVPATNLLAGSPLNLLQSTLFAGAIILFVLLGTEKADGSRLRRRALFARS